MVKNETESVKGVEKKMDLEFILKSIRKKQMRRGDRSVKGMMQIMMWPLLLCSNTTPPPNSTAEREVLTSLAVSLFLSHTDETHTNYLLINIISFSR